MGTGKLTIDHGAIAANWRALDKMSGGTVETAGVVKANGYGLGVAAVSQTLAKLGVRTFFVAIAEEGVELRAALGRGPRIFVFSGHMAGDAEMLRGSDLIPLLNSTEQVTRHLGTSSDIRFGLQLDSGMNRLGLEPGDWAGIRADALKANPVLIMSHLACADTPEHPMNPQQLAVFKSMTDGLDIPKSLAATGGTLLGPEYHFDMNRPGIGIYGGFPFQDAAPVPRLSLPVIQTREVTPGEHVGYGNTWTADAPTRVATVASGYADGLIRAMGRGCNLYHESTPCPLVGRVSMDLLTIDITHLSETPGALDILCPSQTIDDVADAAGTIGYEILTSLGHRYARQTIGSAA